MFLIFAPMGNLFLCALKATVSKRFETVTFSERKNKFPMGAKITNISFGKMNNNNNNKFGIKESLCDPIAVRNSQIQRECAGYIQFVTPKFAKDMFAHSYLITLYRNRKQSFYFKFVVRKWSVNLSIF